MSSIEILLGIGILGCGFGLMGGMIWVNQVNARITKIFHGGSVDNVDELIEAYADKFQSIEHKIEHIASRIALQELISDKSLTKVVLKRFNPFQDMGGDTSFIFVLLDQSNTGVLITNITMREGNRIYAKQITKGVSALSLGGEEEQALNEAIKQDITR